MFNHTHLCWLFEYEFKILLWRFYILIFLTSSINHYFCEFVIYVRYQCPRYVAVIVRVIGQIPFVAVWYSVVTGRLVTVGIVSPIIGAPYPGVPNILLQISSLGWYWSGNCYQCHVMVFVLTQNLWAFLYPFLFTNIFAACALDLLVCHFDLRSRICTGFEVMQCVCGTLNGTASLFFK